MAGLNVNDLVTVSYRSLCVQQRIILVLGYVVTVESLQLTVTGALQLVANFFATEAAQRPLGPYRNISPANMTIEECRAQRIRPTRSSYARSAIAVDGLQGATAPATNICGVITKRSADGSRKGIGRMRTPPLPSGSFAEGVIGAQYRIAMQTMAIEVARVYTIEVGGTVLTPVILPRNFPATAFQVLDTTVQDTVRTQRRRTLRVGE